ncbi:ent-copalyl diphosphate synthase, chloroplastic-like isoform X3 [Malania oleifera]|uniref:ent-copalyl diphosphate synthase, chloroplastic-like isoform X3 n=1 Tax=Malania oleifera TaxID=397392 RepID=UPI0025ADDAD6|nr:ent-copalyl diphosphate synthase, chloroplastic-like isoform X3 [Malania oleifera]
MRRKGKTSPENHIKGKQEQNMSSKASTLLFGLSPTLTSPSISRSSPASKDSPKSFTENKLESYDGIQCQEIVKDDTEKEAPEVYVSNDEIKERVDRIRSMLGSMGDGEITVSAYDTAWVALVEDVNGSGAPQFPSSLQWIAKNQLSDGSWGDHLVFTAHDRILNTLACVIALKKWNTHHDKFKKGMSFIKENISKLENENAEHMPIGFEVAFPSLVEIAQKFDIKIPTNSPNLQEIYARRNLKLTRIPKDIMHQVPTTLLHSLEGMALAGLDWEKLLKLQCSDGSFLFSPSSTAFALIHTKNPNCLAYLNNAVQKFNGGVPNVYPVDLFERIWIVDRLERLGISRYFQSETTKCAHYVHRYWTERGICWARNTPVHDIDDTAMGFKLLRLHGFDVSADVFGHFESDGEFFCFTGQSTQAVTGMFNLYRASQLVFPGEKILEDAKNFSCKFLKEKQATKQLLDKWIIIKDLPGEVGYALEVPWYASLPRVETRFYVEQYGGDNDVWIGKTLYRMPYVNNNNYLELAKLDYNSCQALHQFEWASFQKWSMKDSNKTAQSPLRALIETLNHLSVEATVAHKRNIRPHLCHAWKMWMLSWLEEGASIREQGEAELVVRTINLSSGHWVSEELLSHPRYKSLSILTTRVCHQLHHLKKKKVHDSDNNNRSNMTTPQIELDMQKLVQIVLQNSSDDIDPNIKQTFLIVAKSFYYTTYCNPEVIDQHIAQVLFQRVI